MRYMIIVCSVIGMLLCTTCVYAGDISDLVQEVAKQGNTPSATQIANKALDMIKTGTMEIYGSVSKIAPEVWKAAIKMQYITAIQMIMVPLLILIGLLIGLRYVNKAKWYNSYEQETAQILLTVFSVITGSVLIILTACAIGRFICPEWYVIEDLVSLITKK